MNHNSYLRSVSPFASLNKVALAMPSQAPQRGGMFNNLKGAAGYSKALWNSATAIPHAVLAGVGGTLSGGVGQGFRSAGNAIKADAGDIVSGLQSAGQAAANNLAAPKNLMGNAIAGGGKALWNAAAMPIHAVGAGLAGGVPGAWNAIKTDAGDIAAGLSRAAGNAPAPAAPKPSGVIPFGQQKVAFQSPTPLLANAGYPANQGSNMSDVNKWIDQAGPQLPDRPGTHRRALAPAAKPTRIGDMPVLSSDTAAGKGMTMTGPGAGAAAGVPAIKTPDIDFNNEFKKYHGTSYNPQDGGRDEGLMKQMQEIYKQHGKLSPSLVYNKQYGNKSPYTKSAALSAFDELEKFAQTPRRNLRTAATPVTGPQQYYFTDGSVAPTQSTQPIAIGSGSQVAQPGQGVTVQTRPAANEPIAIGTGNRTVQPGQDVSVRVGPAAADLNNEFKKYHGTSFDPNSSMDKGKMEQMQALYKQHGKLSPSLVYNKQYGTKSAALSAFAELEKSAWLQALARTGAGVLNSGAQAAKRLAGVTAAKGIKMTPKTPVKNPLSPHAPPQRFNGGRDAVVSARNSAYSDAADAVGNKRTRAALGLEDAADFLDKHKRTQLALNYGLPTIAGGGLLYGSNRMGHNSGLGTGRNEGWDAYGAASQGLTPDSPGYFGNLMNAITGQNPVDAASVRNMLDERKSDIMQSIFGGRA